MKILLTTLIFFLQVHSFAFLPDLTIPTSDQALETKAKARHKELDPNSIKLLNWNVYKGKKYNWQEDFQSIFEKYDIMTLQEIITNDIVEKVFQEIIGFERVYAYSFQYNKDKSFTGLTTLSNTKSIYSRYIATSDFEPITNTPKVSLYTKYKIQNSNKELLVANIHSINFVSQQSFENQLDQAFSELHEHKGPIIFAGDFNTWSVKRLMALYKITSKLNLTPVKFSPDKRKKVIGLALDHIFTRGLEVKSSRAIGIIKSSDHVPMEIEVRIRD